MNVNDLRMEFEVTTIGLCEFFENLGVTKFEKLSDGFVLIKDNNFTRITIQEEKDDEKKTTP